MEIFKQLFDGLEKEIKKEIMSDMKNEAYKLKADLSFKTSHLYNELDSIKFENANLLEKNAILHWDEKSESRNWRKQQQQKNQQKLLD